MARSFSSADFSSPHGPSRPDTPPSESLPDLGICESEPIHLPGSIEPNGCMLVLHEPALTILQVSSNVLPFLGREPKDLLEKHLGDVFSTADIQKLVSGRSNDGKRRYVSGVRAQPNQEALDGLVHRHQELLIIELERISTSLPSASGPVIFASLTDALDGLAGSSSLLDLCERVAMCVRQLTGFDRVMVYRFLKDDSGSVVAEDRREDLDPYLGLRYPASDIPPQARRLYLLNALRLKADVNARSAVLLPSLNPITGTPLDMTFCVLRSMSPVHVEYLRNMGVTASMSISVVKDGRLWGLIACHHTEARQLPHAIRITCEVLAGVFSAHISAAEEQDQRVHANALGDLEGRIEARLRQDGNVADTLTEMVQDLSTAIGADGCIFSIRGKMSSWGNTPEGAHAEALLTWLAAHQSEPVFATERMAELYPDAEKSHLLVGGLLSVRIALESADFILWFRPTVVQVVKWAGNPEKPVEETEVGRRISPRLSFELWKQTVRDRSEPWSHADCKFASALRPLVAEMLLLQMNQEIVRLNDDLARSNVELESFAYVASHDLQEPLRGIRAYAQMLIQMADPDRLPQAAKFIAIIEDSAGRMSSLITALLSYSKLGGDERREHKPIDVESALRVVLTDLDLQITESGAVITHDTLPVVLSDQDYVVQLLQNLIGNAIKYRRPNTKPHIHISSRSEGDSFLMSVRDDGQGFDPKHAEIIFVPFKRLHGREVPGNGIGLATCKRIVVDIHEGRIWAESPGNAQGTTIWFTLPAPNREQKSMGQRAQ